MANKNLFSTKKASKVAPATARNVSGALAYDKTKVEQLAQLISTGCMNNTFYSSAETQVDQVIELCRHSDDRFVAAAAVYSRKLAFMKDMPALLMAILSTRNPALFRQMYPRVINNAKMMRNLVQIIRSGKVGRTSLGSSISKAISYQLAQMSDQQLLNATVGNDPSLKDIIKLAHAKPATPSREAFYKYILGFSGGARATKTQYKTSDLPPIVQEFEAWKQDVNQPNPVVDFQLLTGTPGITQENWRQMAINGNWHFTRMNLNTFNRHGLLSDKALVKQIAERLADETMITRSRVFPYQLYNTMQHVTGLPKAIVDALDNALDTTVKNIPEMSGKIGIFIDGSGSMSSPMTGHKEGATTTMSCLEAACLIGAGILKKNAGNADLHIFDTSIKFDSTMCSDINPRKTLREITSFVVSKAKSGGTSISCCLDYIKAHARQYDKVIIISDNESWADYYQRASASTSYGLRKTATATAAKWAAYNNNNKRKLALIDLQPGITTQIQSSDDSVLNVGGFSNVVFDVLGRFFSKEGGSWTDLVQNYAYNTGHNNQEPESEKETGD